MGLIFRQRFKILPGVHLNLSANGVSVSLGVPGATVNLSPRRGAHLALGIPGTGLSYRTSLNPQTGQTPRDLNPAPVPQTSHDGYAVLPEFNSFQDESNRKIHSASVDDLVLVGNAELQKVIKESYENHEQMVREVREMEADATEAERLAQWADNFFFRLFLKKKIQDRKEDAHKKRGAYEEAKPLLDTYGLKLDWSIAPDILQLYNDLVVAFQEASKSSMIWDVTAEKQTDQFRERTLAVKSIERTRISFTFGRPAYMPASMDEKWKVVPQINDASGSMIYIFPGFFIFSSKNNFAVIEPKDIVAIVCGCSFQEEEKVPHDAVVTGQAWKKANKDGSPDKRFNGNYQVPVVGYGKLRLISGEKIEEEYMLSKLDATLQLGMALERFCNWFKYHDSKPKNSNNGGSMDEASAPPSNKGIKPMELDRFIEIFNTGREDLMKPLLSIAAENDSDAPAILFYAFQNIGFSMCGADKVVNIDEAKIIAALGKLFPNMPSISSESWFKSMSGKSEDEWVDIFSRGRQKFGAVYLLDIYDNDNGTNYAEALKKLLFEFALVMANADGEVSPEELAYLKDLTRGDKALGSN
jgi:hypothetical protein